MRHGIKTIIIPDKNKKDLEDIPEEYRNALTFIPVKAIDEVLEVVLTQKIAGKSGAHGTGTAGKDGKDGKDEKGSKASRRRGPHHPGYDRAA